MISVLYTTDIFNVIPNLFRNLIMLICNNLEQGSGTNQVDNDELLFIMDIQIKLKLKDIYGRLF